MAVALAGVMAAGCDASIDTPPSLRGPYTLWGALDPTGDTQAVRAVALTDTLLAQSPAPLPVTVTSTDLATGEGTVWRDSLVTFRNGSIGHVYRARFRPGFGGRYRVAVRRDGDGGAVSATMAIPPLVVPVVQPVNLTDGTKVTVFWPGAAQLNRVRVTYTVQNADCDTLALRVTESVGASGPVEGGWAVILNVSRVGTAVYTLASGEFIRRTGRFDPDLSLGLRRVTVQGDVATEEWRPPGNVFDFEALAALEVFDNVAGGFGFVGGSYRTRPSFDPDPRDLRRTRFVDRSDCPFE